MKKILSLILVLIACTSLFSCGNGNAETTEAETEVATETESKQIPLNLFNYEDYIEINCSVEGGESSWDSYKREYVYYTAYCDAEAVGNPHYKYNNVTIEIKFSIYDKINYQNYLKRNIALLKGQSTDNIGEAKPYDDVTCFLNLNLAGNGSASNKLLYVPIEDYTLQQVFDRTMFEIVSISGTVEEY